MPIVTVCKAYPLSLFCSHMVKIYMSKKKNPISISLKTAIPSIQQHWCNRIPRSELNKISAPKSDKLAICGLKITSLTNSSLLKIIAFISC